MPSSGMLAAGCSYTLNFFLKDVFNHVILLIIHKFGEYSVSALHKVILIVKE